MTGTKLKLLVSFSLGNVFLCCLFVLFQWTPDNADSVVQHDIFEKRMKPFTDYYCLKTLESIRRDQDGNFLIPNTDALQKLPVEVLDCLYHRYSTTLQTYCAKRSRHGTITDGWNICLDGCYKPKSDDNVHVISNQKDLKTVKSFTKEHHSTIYHYNAKRDFESKEKLVSTLNKSVNRRDVVIIDAEDSTEDILDIILRSNALSNVQQLLIRTSYGTGTQINYIKALNHLRQIFKNDFRIFWSKTEWQCTLANNKNRTGCFYLHMVYRKCRKESGMTEHQHLILPEDSAMVSMDKTARGNLYHRYLTSIQIQCKEIIRLGGNRGGWDICNDVKYRPKQSCLVYSFGIHWNFKFDDAIAEAYDCAVHSFDPSMNYTKDFKRSDKVWFHNLGLAGRTYYDTKRKWNMSTLKDIRHNLHHASQTIDVLKMDIEWSEWEAVPDMVNSGALRDIQQLYIEFHSPGTLQHLRVLKLLYDEGYRIFLYNQNDKCGLDRLYVQHSICNEVYFLRENATWHH